MALINARLLKGYPDLVRISFEAEESVCSGFYVNSTTIITAAHCFYSYKDNRLLKIVAIQTVNEMKLKVKTIKLIPHPKYYIGGWSQNDIGIIKTTQNKLFKNNFPLKNTALDLTGKVTLFGAGKLSIDPKQYGRTIGVNRYIGAGPFLFSLGDPSIAPNDSGAPVMNRKEVIGLASKSNRDKFFPALSVVTILGTKENWDFIMKNKN